MSTCKHCAEVAGTGPVVAMLNRYKYNTCPCYLTASITTPHVHAASLRCVHVFMTSLVHKYAHYPTTLLVFTKLLCRVLLPCYPATYTAKVAFTEMPYIMAMILECAQKLFGYISQVMIISDFILCLVHTINFAW